MWRKFWCHDYHHYQRLLNYIKPDAVHIMMDGRVVLSGGEELAARLEKKDMQKLPKNSVLNMKKKCN